MSLDDCIDIGSENGCTTLIDCVEFVESHAMQLFDYNKIQDELDELHIEIKAKFPMFYKKHFSNGRFIFEKKD